MPATTELGPETSKGEGGDSTHSAAGVALGGLPAFEEGSFWPRRRTQGTAAGTTAEDATPPGSPTGRRVSRVPVPSSARDSLSPQGRKCPGHLGSRREPRRLVRFPCRRCGGRAGVRRARVMDFPGGLRRRSFVLGTTTRPQSQPFPGGPEPPVSGPRPSPVVG